MAMGQYWLGKTQTSFQIDLKYFQKVDTELFNEIFHWLTG